MAKGYTIPENFIDGGKVLHGTFKTRNLTEGIILGGSGLFLSLQLPIHSIATQITVSTFMAAPGFILGLFGINDDPLSVALLNFFKWRRNRKIMLYNGTAQGRSDDIVEQMMQQQTPQEVLSERLKKMREKEEAESVLIEGVDFQFEQDPELTRYNKE